MTNLSTLRLDAADARVQAARQAEQRLFAHYDLHGQDHRVELPAYGVSVRVTEFGAGEPILIVPGNTGDAFPFAPLLAQLRDRRILALNRPGGGLSDGMDHHGVDFHRLAVDTIDAALDAFGLEQVVLMGHSIGGHWCQWYAMDRPQRVKRLILLGVPGNVLNAAPPLALRLLAVPHLNRLLFRLIQSGGTKGRGPQGRGPQDHVAQSSIRTLTFMGHPAQTLQRLPPELAECYFHFQRLPNYALSSLSMMESINRPTGSSPSIAITAEQLARIQAATLLLWGDRDPFGSPAVGRKIAACIPQATFHLISPGGHLPWLDAPEECGREIERFIG